jgi:hypothetical protein
MNAYDIEGEDCSFDLDASYAEHLPASPEDGREHWDEGSGTDGPYPDVYLNVILPSALEGQTEGSTTARYETSQAVTWNERVLTRMSGRSQTLQLLVYDLDAETEDVETMVECERELTQEDFVAGELEVPCQGATIRLELTPSADPPEGFDATDEMAE